MKWIEKEVEEEWEFEEWRGKNGCSDRFAYAAIKEFCVLGAQP